MSDIKYSMVIPVYNEEASVEKVLNEVKEALNQLDAPYEIIVVNDNSTDKSMDIVKQHGGIRIINHEINRGYGASIKSGVNAAKSNTIIIIDADGTYPASEIPKLVNYTDSYDLVSSARVGKDVSIPLIRRFGKFFLHRLINFLSGQHIPDMNSGLRVFKKDVFMKYASLCPSGFSISTTLLLACLHNGHPVKFVPINYLPRKGRSKIKIFRDGFNFVLLILRSITYFNPLKIFIPLSIAFFAAALFMAFFSIYFLGKFTDVTVLLLFISSILIGLFGLIADAISKIMMKT